MLPRKNIVALIEFKEAKKLAPFYEGLNEMIKKIESMLGQNEETPQTLHMLNKLESVQQEHHPVN